VSLTIHIVGHSTLSREQFQYLADKQDKGEKMKEVKMDGEAIQQEVEFEDDCGVNTFLQFLYSHYKMIR